MITKSELLTAIDELEDSAPTFQNCQKMATFYTLLNSMYRKPEYSDGYSNRAEPITEEVVGSHGQSEFLESVKGLDSDYVWRLMDELMDTVRVLQPKIYDSVMRQIRD